MLEVRGLSLLYGKAQILFGVDLEVREGELVCLVGPNGAGKTSFLRAISGLVRLEARLHRGTKAGEIRLEGEVRFQGRRIDGLLPHQIARLGLVLCPERRRPFRELTVEENLLAGGLLLPKGEVGRQLAFVYELFPRLRERRKQRAGDLSGGEQQMLAIGRALMARPKLLAVDEPSTGLAPKVRALVFEQIARVRREGVTVLLVEQEAARALALADRAYLLSNGRLVRHGPAQSFLEDPQFQRAYLGL
ncbi:MAG: ABC transporter ATP-binding protein [Thermus sp.]|uniref:ABC transporter ATP-binding protein n=2 Tax=Thermaceae TaxID=188786 RepID=UPI0025FD8086|nr:ABC transporter ATP-binding protein [Thermus sp.]MCS7219224.1 ABC transporter ATP-binding protein [Thermus sp.]MCX7850461.1 ABC transporter ATP-binding protein [Thermus sp.]MDW8018015.1 ABC transporter ATP-binding protein [Thermus sp.]MDW8357884.1 ABC transporter ATP-binding protein [Thermus sp.]